MALLAEVIVEEWLNRQGYFTLRGVKTGVDEIDLLAIRPERGKLECRHLEVQASMRPVSYISKVPKGVQKREGRAANSAKRSIEELEIGVREWVSNKFDKAKKRTLIASLAPGPWSKELVIHRVKSVEEVNLITSHGIVIHHLSAIVRDLRSGSFRIESAGGADFMDLLLMGDHAASTSAVDDALAAAVYDPRRAKR